MKLTHSTSRALKYYKVPASLTLSVASAFLVFTQGPDVFLKMAGGLIGISILMSNTNFQKANEKNKNLTLAAMGFITSALSTASAAYAVSSQGSLSPTSALLLNLRQEIDLEDNRPPRLRIEEAVASKKGYIVALCAASILLGGMIATYRKDYNVNQSLQNGLTLQQYAKKHTDNPIWLGVGTVIAVGAIYKFLNAVKYYNKQEQDALIEQDRKKQQLVP